MRLGTVASRFPLLAALALVLGGALPARAQQPAGPIVIAIYAPNAPFEGADARYSYVQRLAAHIGSVAGVPTKGQAFARAGDFEGAVKKGTVDFAIVDSVYLAARTFKVIATGTTGGSTAKHWALFVGAGIPNFTALQGKRLAYASSGPRDLAFIEHAMLDSEINVGKFFGAKQGTPDVASAVAAVALGKADCVVAPVDRGKGLRKIFDAGSVPNPGFVQVKTGLPEALVASVSKAVLGFGAGGALDGWRGGGGDAFRGLAGRMGARTRKAAMSEPDVLRLESQDVLLLGKIDAALPPLQHYFWTP
ncbi:MAG: PhnD/SsuA/transferrin family substrate-binding protein [Deltaproteobacteria bacterium]|nr:PhnD/SsuA/transferrin family substrate-binding protein [Deltaproteobacteria bacterium]